MVKLLTPKLILYIAWLQSLVATLGSLFFSEVMHFTPCVLCWYQRILMYPLVAVIATTILKKEPKPYHYVLPLSLLGWVISIYHNLLYYGIVSEHLAPCTTTAPCTTHFFAWFGFITIPLLSFTAFTVINTCMLFLVRYHKTHDK